MAIVLSALTLDVAHCAQWTLGAVAVIAFSLEFDVSEPCFEGPGSEATISTRDISLWNRDTGLALFPCRCNHRKKKVPLNR